MLLEKKPVWAVSECRAWLQQVGSKDWLVTGNTGLFWQCWGWLGLLVAIRKQSKREPAPLYWCLLLPAEMLVMFSFARPSHSPRGGNKAIAGGLQGTEPAR